MSASDGPLRVVQHTPAYWRVTLDNPPLNLLDPETIAAFVSLIDQLEKSETVNVVVFDSAAPDFFMAHFDLLRAGHLDFTPGPSGLSQFPDFAVRLERAPFVTIGLIRGRARGAGSEFLQALDMRFASREHAIFGQPEVGSGIIPGGGGLERLPLLTGRARAMEIIIGGDDFDADTAERYGWINRSLPDSELNEFVERLATRIAGFDRQAIALAKSILNRRGTLPQDTDLAETQAAFFEAIAWPSAQARVAKLMERGFQRHGDLELHLGERLADL